MTTHTNNQQTNGPTAPPSDLLPANASQRRLTLLTTSLGLPAMVVSP
jgi:hypothetical protein